MKQVIIFSYFFFLVSINSFSQNTGLIDSLKNVLQSSKTDSIKAATLNELSFQLLDVNLADAEIYAQDALDLSKNSNIPIEEAASYIRFGLIQQEKGNTQAALDFFLDALKIRRNLNDTIAIVNAYNNLGNLYELTGDFNQAKTYFLQSLDILGEKDERLKALLLSNIGTTYKNLGEYNNALKSFLEAIDIREKLKDYEGLGYAYAGLASFENQIKNYDQALEYYNKSLEIFSKLENENIMFALFNNIGNVYFANENYERAIENYDLLLKSNLASPLEKSIVLSNIGSALEKNGEYSKSIEVYEESMNILDSLNDPLGLAISNNNLGLAYFSQDNFKSALPLFLKGFSIVDTLSNKVLKAEILNNLYATYSKLGEFDKAIQYSSKYHVLEDSIDEAEKEVLNLKIQLSEERYDRVILNKTKELQKSQNRQKTIIIIALSISLILITLLFFASIRARKQKEQRLLAEKNAQINQNKIDKLLKDTELKSTYARLEGQDTERQRIAQDLHDRLGGMLATVKLYFKAVEDKIEELKDVNKTQYQKANELLEKACEEVRNISHDMQSGVLAKFGLELALEDLAETIQQSKQIKVTLSTLGLDKRLNSKIEGNIYKIIQELISNVLKHAKASEMTIRVNLYNGSLNILVEDDGIGFDKEKLEKGGFGLKNIESRINSLGGILNIDSGKGAGTTISIDLEI